MTTEQAARPQAVTGKEYQLFIKGQWVPSSTGLNKKMGKAEIRSDAFVRVEVKNSTPSPAS